MTWLWLLGRFDRSGFHHRNGSVMRRAVSWRMLLSVNKYSARCNARRMVAGMAELETFVQRSPRACLKCRNVAPRHGHTKPSLHAALAKAHARDKPAGEWE